MVIISPPWIINLPCEHSACHWRSLRTLCQSIRLGQSFIVSLDHHFCHSKLPTFYHNNRPNYGRIFLNSLDILFVQTTKQIVWHLLFVINELISFLWNHLICIKISLSSFSCILAPGRLGKESKYWSNNNSSIYNLPGSTYDRLGAILLGGIDIICISNSELM